MNTNKETLKLETGKTYVFKDEASREAFLKIDTSNKALTKKYYNDGFEIKSKNCLGGNLKNGNLAIATEELEYFKLKEENPMYINFKDGELPEVGETVYWRGGSYKQEPFKKWIKHEELKVIAIVEMDGEKIPVVQSVKYENVTSVLLDLLLKKDTRTAKQIAIDDAYNLLSENTTKQEDIKTLSLIYDEWVGE